MRAVVRPAPQAVAARARKSARTILLRTPPRQTRVAHRGGRSVRRKRRPTAAVDKPALCHANVLEQPEGSPVSTMAQPGGPPAAPAGGLEERKTEQPKQSDHVGLTQASRPPRNPVRFRPHRSSTADKAIPKRSRRRKRLPHLPRPLLVIAMQVHRMRRMGVSHPARRCRPQFRRQCPIGLCKVSVRRVVPVQPRRVQQAHDGRGAHARAQAAGEQTSSSSPTDDELHTLPQTIIARLMKLLTRRAVLVEDMGQTYLAEPDIDGEEGAYAAGRRPSGGGHVPHRLRAARRPEGADLQGHDSTRGHGAPAAVRRNRRLQPARRGSGRST